MTQPDFEKLAQDYLDFVKGFPRAVFPIPQEASEDDIVRASYTWPSPMSVSSPWRQIDRAYFPQMVEALAKEVGRDYNANTTRALGYTLCRWMTSIDGRTPALLEGNYGQCMAVIDRNIDLTGMKPLSRPNWLENGEETRLDEARAAAHTYASAPGLFAPLYLGEGNTIVRSLAALGRITKKDLQPSYVNEHLYDNLMEMGPDVPLFITMAMNQLEVDEARALDIYQALGLLDDWGVEDEGGVEPEKLNAWREALDPTKKLSPTQALGKSRLDKMTLQAISQQRTNHKPAKASKTPKM